MAYGVSCHDDLMDMGIRPELHAQRGEKSIFLPQACYTLEKRRKVCVNVFGVLKYHRILIEYLKMCSNERLEDCQAQVP